MYPKGADRNAAAFAHDIHDIYLSKEGFHWLSTNNN
jgi:hypothetical protein